MCIILFKNICLHSNNCCYFFSFFCVKCPDTFGCDCMEMMDRDHHLTSRVFFILIQLVLRVFASGVHAFTFSRSAVTFINRRRSTCLSNNDLRLPARDSITITGQLSTHDDYEESQAVIFSDVM